MRPTVQLDTRAFNQQLREVAAQSSRDGADVVNSRMSFVIRKAIQFTEKSNKAEIQHVLGQVGNALVLTKKGDRLRKGKGGRGRAVLKENSFAALIVNARRRDQAGPDYMLWGNALEEAARKLIAARVRSVAFIKSGWAWAFREILPFVKFKRPPGSVPDPDAKPRGQPKGFATAAKASNRIVATAENRALMASGGKYQAPGPHNPLPIAEAGLKLALASEQAEMTRHLKEKMQQSLRQKGIPTTG